MIEKHNGQRFGTETTISIFGFQHLLAGISEPRPVENRMWISENLIEMYFLNSLIRYCNYGWKSIVLKRLGASQSHLQISMLELVFLNQGFVDLTRKEISDPKINITNRSGIEFYAQRGPQNSNNFKCQDRGRELTRSKENPRFKKSIKSDQKMSQNSRKFRRLRRAKGVQK